jgi:hypothetical protein
MMALNVPKTVIKAIDRRRRAFFGLVMMFVMAPNA